MSPAEEKKVEEPIENSIKVSAEIPKEEAAAMKEPVVERNQEVDAKDKASEHDTTEMKIEEEADKKTHSGVASPKEQFKV